LKGLIKEDKTHGRYVRVVVDADVAPDLCSFVFDTPRDDKLLAKDDGWTGFLVGAVDVHHGFKRWACWELGWRLHN
jgi:hypothetical protein